MGSPSHPSPPGDQAGPAKPGTAEIPVVRPAAAPGTKQLPPHPGATAFGALPTTAVQPRPQPQPQPQAPQPTGPVDFVPGLPGAPAPPPPAGATVAAAPPASAPPAGVTAAASPVPTWPETLESEDSARERGRRGLRLPQDRGALVPVGLAALAVVLLQLGLSLELGSESWWESVPLWSAFATAATVVGLVCLVLAKRGRPSADQAWRAGAAALVGLSVFWLLVVLPVAGGDRGFLLTAALGCLGAALWMAAERD